MAYPSKFEMNVFEIQIRDIHNGKPLPLLHVREPQWRLWC